MKPSSYLLGRIDTRAKFNAGRTVTLSAYRTRRGELRYTIANPSTIPKPSVLYRIHLQAAP